MGSLKIYLVLLLIVVGIFSFSGCKSMFSPEDGDGDGDDNTNCSNHPAMGSVGQTIKSCFFEMTLKDNVEVRESVCDGYIVAGKTPGTHLEIREGEWEYVIVEINVKAISNYLHDNAPLFLGFDQFKITDSNNNRYEGNDVDFYVQIFNCYPGLWMWDNNRNYNVGEQTGFLKLIFELPKASKELILRLDSENNTLEFNLGI